MTLKQIKLFNLFVLGFALAFIIFVVFPKGRDIYDLQKKIEMTKIKISNGKRALEHQPSLEKQVQIQTSLLNRIPSLFLHKNEQPKVYQIINATAKKTQVEILSLKPQPQDISEELFLGTKITYRQLSLRIEAKGQYKDLACFIHALTHAAKYFSLSEMTMQNSENKSDPIKATLILNEYLLVNHE